MNFSTRICCAASIVTVVAAAGVASAQPVPSVYADWTTLTGVKDDSNIVDASVSFLGFMEHNEEDAEDYYINALDLETGSSWDENLSIELPSDIAHDDGVYSFGEAITPGTTWTGAEFARLAGTVSPDVAPGLYDFEVAVYGGANFEALEILDWIYFEIEVVDFIDVSVSTTPVSTTPGSTVDIPMTVENNAGRKFYINSIYSFTNFDNGSGDNLEFEGHRVEWLQGIDDGGDVTERHSTWSTAPDQPLGVYDGFVGIEGGLNRGDRFDFRLQPQVDVVPEPGAMACFVLAGAVLLARRR